MSTCRRRPIESGGMRRAVANGLPSGSITDAERRTLRLTLLDR
jgi:hypothetical protein